MHWILQENMFNEKAYDTLIETLERSDIEHSLHKVVPFVGELMPEPTLRSKNAICFGSYSMRHYAKKHELTPGVFDLEKFDFTVQLEKWGSEMLNSDSHIVKFKDASFSDIAFLRPIQDSKIFAGRVFDEHEFKNWQRKVCQLREDHGDSLTPESLIQISSCKKICSEHRFWIVKKNIVSASTYKIGNRVQYLPCIDEQIHEYVKQQISIWQPDEAFVIDVANTEDGFKIVEINTLNSAGFYACDIQKLVFALEDEFSKEFL